VAITFDPAKNARNIRERGLSFERVADFDFDTALFKIDDRHDYGEVRTRAVGFLDGRLHVLVFTERGEDIRVISLRKANRAEMRRYANVKSGRTGR
jgi:uncharacterized DUF497 family protein